SPSLFDRDAYQADLKASPDLIHGLQLNIQWRPERGAGTYILKTELRGTAGQLAIDREVSGKGRFSSWEEVKLSEDQHKTLGQLRAWRVSLWQDDRVIGEQTSFLW